VQGLHLIIVALFLGFGVYYLFVEQSPIPAIHYLLVALYFFVHLFELRGQPFSRPVYLLLVLLLVADGILHVFILPYHLITGLFSFFFAFLAFQSMQRLRRH